MFNRSFLRRRKLSNTPQALLQYSSASTGDQFGRSVALSSDGTTAICGVPYDDPNSIGSNTGSAVVFICSNKTWTQQAILSPTGYAPFDETGTSVAISSDGNTAIIGRPGGSIIGNAIVFTRSGATWTQQQIISQTGGTPGNKFGFSVALSSDGNTAIVGAYSANSQQGNATIFTRSGITWTQQQTITQTGGAANDLFGVSVALSSDGNTAIVGAYFDDVGANVDQGSATIFTRSGATWTQQQTITQTGGAANDGFGWAVALSSDGNTAIVTTYFINSFQGNATIFTRSGGVWTQQQTITKSNGAANDQFGWSVTLSGDGNTAILGARLSNSVAGSTTGSATVFTRLNSVWTQQQVISRTNGATGDRLGSAVALSTDGNTAIAGASGIKTPFTSCGGAIVFYNH
jgi:hypothetical protein